MKMLVDTYVFLSAELSYADAESNKSRTTELGLQLDSLFSVVVPVDGAYKGKQEHSFAVWAKDEAAIEQLLQIAADNLQESIMVRYGDYSCQLRFTNGRVQEIGQWTEISEQRAESIYAYTEIAGKYFAAI